MAETAKSTDDIDAIHRHLSMAAGIACVARNANEEELPDDAVRNAMWALEHHLDNVTAAADRLWDELAALRMAEKERGISDQRRPVTQFAKA